VNGQRVTAWKWLANMPIFESCRFAHFMHLCRRFKKLMDMGYGYRTKSCKSDAPKVARTATEYCVPLLFYIQDFLIVKYFENVGNLTKLISPALNTIQTIIPHVCNFIQTIIFIDVTLLYKYRRKIMRSMANFQITKSVLIV
jgi:hypothetical protein